MSYFNSRYDAVKDSQPVKEWRDEEILVSSRSKFDGSHLIISETEISDAGSYRYILNPFNFQPQ